MGFKKEKKATETHNVLTELAANYCVKGAQLEVLSVLENEAKRDWWGTGGFVKGNDRQAADWFDLIGAKILQSQVCQNLLRLFASNSADLNNFPPNLCHYHLDFSHFRLLLLHKLLPGNLPCYFENRACFVLYCNKYHKIHFEGLIRRKVTIPFLLVSHSLLV